MRPCLSNDRLDHAGRSLPFYVRGNKSYAGRGFTVPVRSSLPQADETPRIAVKIDAPGRNT